ncbi:MAG: nuclear transport factor 2 family protein [Deltaproteobacteria bacterium]|nr:nuclear transport factor 2 family protein [Deltaproteobacteria bacterium]MBI3388764.1 nuclear transport factor 2 family protein [Deltaproteobacteria bacterium]
MSDTEHIDAANRRFYAAFESLDVAQMETAWLREGHISCVHPGWAPLFGWGPVMQSWQQLFAHTLMMRFTLSNVNIHVSGDVAWVQLTETIESQHGQGSGAGVIQATNIFERRGDTWYLVHHHGSPIVHPEEGEASRLQ